MLMPTYQAGLLQAKSYRALKNYLRPILSEHKLTMAEWALLGQLYQVGQGVRLAVVAEALDVEPPLVTRLVDQLERQSLLERQNDPDDRRAKRIRLTDIGSARVEAVEVQLRTAMKKLLDGVSLEDLGAYLRVMEAICFKADPI